MKMTADYRPGQGVYVSNGRVRLKGTVLDVKWLIKERLAREIQMCLVAVEHGPKGRDKVEATSEDIRQRNPRGEPISDAWFIVEPSNPDDPKASDRNVVDFKFQRGDGVWCKNETLESEYRPQGSNLPRQEAYFPGHVEWLIWYRVGRGDYRKRYKVDYQRTWQPAMDEYFARLQTVMPSEQIEGVMSNWIEEDEAISTDEAPPTLLNVAAEVAKTAYIEPDPIPELVGAGKGEKADEAKKPKFVQKTS